MAFCAASNSGWFPFHRKVCILSTGQKRAENSRVKSRRVKGNVVEQLGQITFSQARRKQPCTCARNRNNELLTDPHHQVLYSRIINAMNDVISWVSCWDEHLRCDYILSWWSVISAGRLDTIWWCHVLHVITIMDSCLYSWWTIRKYMYLCISVDMECFVINHVIVYVSEALFFSFSVTRQASTEARFCLRVRSNVKDFIYCICGITSKRDYAVAHIWTYITYQLCLCLKYLQLYF